MRISHLNFYSYKMPILFNRFFFRFSMKNVHINIIILSGSVTVEFHWNDTIFWEVIENQFLNPWYCKGKLFNNSVTCKFSEFEKFLIRFKLLFKSKFWSPPVSISVPALLSTSLAWSKNSTFWDTSPDVHCNSLLNVFLNISYLLLQNLLSVFLFFYN